MIFTGPLGRTVSSYSILIVNTSAQKIIKTQYLHDVQGFDLLNFLLIGKFYYFISSCQTKKTRSEGHRRRWSQRDVY